MKDYTDSEGQTFEDIDNHIQQFPWYIHKFYNSHIPIGEGTIKAHIFLDAWHSYCMESRIFRILRFFGLRS